MWKRQCKSPKRNFGLYSGGFRYWPFKEDVDLHTSGKSIVFDLMMESEKFYSEEEDPRGQKGQGIFRDEVISVREDRDVKKLWFLSDAEYYSAFLTYYSVLKKKES